MIQRQLKLDLTVKQQKLLEAWLFHLTAVWNWAIRKIELDAKDKIYYSRYSFQNLLAGHSKRLGVPSHTLQGTLNVAFTAWESCFKKISKKPQLKGKRNKLNSIPFPDPLERPETNRIKILRLGSVRFHKQDIPEGKIKCSRIIKRASGWYLCLFIDAEPSPIPFTGKGMVGIDPGFKHLLTLSTGEKTAHPNEAGTRAKRLGQAQRGKHRQLVARINERTTNQKQDRNHKLSRRLIAENEVIVWSKDQGLAGISGKSVARAGHAQLRKMIAYKCIASGRQFIEVDSKFSTMTCSACGSLSGPTGYAGLKVRSWVCVACGASHDRDVNAAINTLKAGVGTTHESRCETASGILIP